MNLKEQVLSTLNKLPKLSNKDLYALFPDADQGSIRNYRSEFLKSITTPNSYISKPVKVSFQDKKSEFKLDTDLGEFEGIELIKHTCEKVIKNTSIDWVNRLKALNIYVQYNDKAGTIKPMLNKDQLDQYKQLPTQELIEKLKTALPGEDTTFDYIDNIEEESNG